MHRAATNMTAREVVVTIRSRMGNLTPDTGNRRQPPAALSGVVFTSPSGADRSPVEFGERRARDAVRARGSRRMSRDFDGRTDGEPVFRPRHRRHPAHLDLPFDLLTFVVGRFEEYPRMRVPHEDFRDGPLRLHALGLVVRRGGRMMS